MVADTLVMQSNVYLDFLHSMLTLEVHKVNLNLYRQKLSLRSIDEKLSDVAFFVSKSKFFVFLAVQYKTLFVRAGGEG